jgi:hypothetical protein
MNYELKYKMFAADFDDTILNSNHKITPKFLTAVHKYIQKGGIFVLATGRTTASILPFCERLNIKGELISYQGAVISDIETGKIIKKFTIENGILTKALTYLHGRGVYHQIYNQNGDILVEKRTEFTDRYVKLSGLKCIEIKQPLYKYVSENNLDTLKVLIVDDETRTQALKEELCAVFGNVVNVFTSKSWIVEITPRQACKGIALKFLAEKYKIDPSKIIAVGDGENDVGMIKFAALGAAVENACQKAKDAAKIIAPSNDNDGVAWLIENYGLVEKL